MSTNPPPLQADRSKFPGMRVAEGALMRAWHALHESEYDRFDYNVRIGVARDPGPDYPDWVRKTAAMSSQRRLDAVAWKGAQVTLIELKNYAWPSAVQQLSMYGAIWAMEHPGEPKPLLRLVVRGRDVSTVASAEPAGVMIEVVS